MRGMELGGGDHLRKLFHIHRLDIDNVWGQNRHILKLLSLIPRFHRFMRRSSALMYVSPSEFTDNELMWYACAFA